MSGSLAVVPVTDRRSLARFVDLPYRLYRGDRCWAPLLKRDVRELLTPGQNPFFLNAEQQLFLALRGDRVVGRVAAIQNRRHNQVHQDRVGFFGFFECEDDREAARALLAAAESWVAQRGLNALRGPCSPSLNDEAGLLVSGFDTPAVLMMPHNPAYYVNLIEAFGLTKQKDLLVFQQWATGVPQRLVEGARMVESRHRVTVRRLDKRRFAEEVARLKQIYNAAWERNWGFVPMTDSEMDHLAAQLKPVVDPDLALFAEVDGQPIAVAVALPDLNVALRANPSGNLFPGVLKVLWASRHIDRLRIIILGALPEWRHRGVDALLYERIWSTAVRKGYTWGEAGWILEDNRPMRNALVRMGFEIYKTYRVYQKPVGPVAPDSP